MKHLLSILLLLSSISLVGQTPFPDNVIESECNGSIQGEPWNIQRLYSTNNHQVASYSPIVVGDIDGNGVTDIVVGKYAGDNNYRTRQILVYSGLDLSLQHSFNVHDTIYLQNGPYAIGRYPLSNGTIQGAIFIHGYDKKIRSYTIDGTLLNVSDRPTSCDGMVSLADFNGDGYPEVYSGSDIFDAATLKWLCSGPESGNKGLSFRGTPYYSYGVHHHCYYAMSLAYNVLGDEKQELICGNTIYDVDIQSRTNPSLNSISINKTITPPSNFTPDGHVSIADFDLDGECEILVIRDDTDDQTVDDCYFYAYKPSSGQIIFQNAHLCSSTSYVFIGNTDSDPYPEIVFLENQPKYHNEAIICWRYTPQSGLNTIWSQNHNDTSGMTAMTLFDFNQDGIFELVFRDNTHLRIINASGISHVTGNDTIRPYNIYTQVMGAGTGIEYPVVADVNNDGAAEIVVTGVLNQTFNDNVGYGDLHIFGNPNSWGAARKVWNQYMYHVTNVNEDLTIPTFCFDIATVFTGSDGTIRRPYNSFLQQAGYITPTGEPYNPSSTTHTYLSKTVCDSYTWNGTTYTESGIYEQTFTAEQGCDSIVVLDLTVEASSYVSPIHGESLIYYQTNDTFTYNIDPVTGCFGYEWSLEGPWSINFSPDSPECTVNVTSPGTATLKVRVYTECGYVERHLFINHDAHPDIVVYPNPTKGEFNIVLYGMQGEAVIVVYDYLGQFIDRFGVDTNLEGTIVPYSLAGKAAGVYLICAMNHYEKVTKKVIKETPSSYGLFNWDW